MAQDQPTKLPEWGSVPPSSPPTTITEPTEPTKQAGFQPGRLRRSYLNWWMNLVYQWLVWLKSLTLRSFNLFFPDQALPGTVGDLPSIGAGLSVAAADFSARVVADGWLIGPVDSLAYVYSASKDTYWDLSRAGTWTAVVVNNGAGAPALTANSVRCFKVVTNATDRTSVTDSRLTYPRIDTVFDIAQIRLGEYLRGSSANLNLARIFARYKGGGGTGYTCVFESENDSGSLLATRIYMRHTYQDLVAVRGAKYKASDNTWDFDAGALSATMETLGYHKEFHELNALIIAANFADSVWYSAATATNGVIKRMDFTSQIQAGIDLSSGDYQKSQLFRFMAKVYGTAHREALFDGKWIKFYAVPALKGTAGTNGVGGEIAINCVWNDATDKWDKIDNTTNAMKIDIAADFGFSILSHLSGDSWDDDFTSGNWYRTFGIDMDSLLSAPVTPNILKASGKVETDGAGGFTTQSGFGYSVTLPSATTMRITLDTPMNTDDELWPVVSYTGSAFIGVSVPNAGYFDISLLHTDGATPLQFDNAVRKIFFHVAGQI